jgi:hypothetical protein
MRFCNFIMISFPPLLKPQSLPTPTNRLFLLLPGLEYFSINSTHFIRADRHIAHERRMKYYFHQVKRERTASVFSWLLVVAGWKGINFSSWNDKLNELLGIFMTHEHVSYFSCRIHFFNRVYKRLECWGYSLLRKESGGRSLQSAYTMGLI